MAVVRLTASAWAPCFADAVLGWPVRVRGVEGVVAVVVVSGLRQEQDHGIIVQAVGEMLQELGDESLEKRKED